MPDNDEIEKYTVMALKLAEKQLAAILALQPKIENDIITKTGNDKIKAEVKKTFNNARKEELNKEIDRLNVKLDKLRSRTHSEPPLPSQARPQEVEPPASISEPTTPQRSRIVHPEETQSAAGHMQKIFEIEENIKKIDDVLKKNPELAGELVELRQGLEIEKAPLVAEARGTVIGANRSPSPPAAPASPAIDLAAAASPALDQRPALASPATPQLPPLPNPQRPTSPPPISSPIPSQPHRHRSDAVLNPQSRSMPELPPNQAPNENTPPPVRREQAKTEPTLPSYVRNPGLEETQKLVGRVQEIEGIKEKIQELKTHNEHSRETIPIYDDDPQQQSVIQENIAAREDMISNLEKQVAELSGPSKKELLSTIAQKYSAMEKDAPTDLSKKPAPERGVVLGTHRPDKAPELDKQKEQTHDLDQTRKGSDDLSKGR